MTVKMTAENARKFTAALRTDYQQTFGQPAGQRVLMDLAPFCSAADTPLAGKRGGPVDLERTFILLGRNEVWVRIQRHLNLTSEQLYALYGGQQFNPSGAEDG